MNGKRILSAALAGAMLCGLCPPVTASAADGENYESGYAELVQLCADTPEYIDEIQFQANSTQMSINGESTLIDPDQPGRQVTPQFVGGRTLLPARALAEALGGEVSYTNGQVKIVARDETEIELQKNSTIMKVDGETIRLDVAPMTVDNRIFIPTRAVSESLSCEVDWNPANKQVTITQPCQTRRLLVLSDSTIPDTNPEQLIEVGPGVYVLTYPTVNAAAEALAALEKANITAWPDAPAATEIQDDTSTSAQSGTSWEDAHCGLSDFISQGGSRSVTVAVMDSGIDSSLSLFRNRLKTGRTFHQGLSASAPPKDGYGHGTFVSGLIAKYTPENVKILPVKIWDSQGLAGGEHKLFLSLYASALSYVRLQKADIVNMSFISFDPKVGDLTQEILINNGISVVCAAGNYGKQKDDSSNVANCSPARLTGAVVVAATDQNDKPADFSNYGNTVDLSAPGQGVSSVAIGGRAKVDSGTSFAAPLVTAAGAVMLTKQAYTPSALETELKKHVMAFPSGAGSGYGAGILSLGTAQPAPAATVKSLQYSVSSLEVAVGETTAVKVTATYTDGTTKDVTSTCGLYSTAAGTATVDNNGTVKGIKLGTATITMRTPPDKAAVPTPVNVTVKAASAAKIVSLKYNVSSLSLAEGDAGTVKVTATYSDGTTKDVTSSCGLYSTAAAIATVDSSGSVRGVKQGAATITMRSPPDNAQVPTPINVTVKAASTAKIVSLKYNVSSLSLTEGGTGTVKVTATYSDGTTKDVTSECGLYSTSTGVATVTGSGTVKGVKQGTAKISISTIPSGVSLPSPVTVTVKPAQTGKKIVSLKYNVNSLSLAEGGTGTVKVTATYSDGTTKDVTSECGLYSTSTGVATVTGSGTVKGVKQGTAKISISTIPSGVSLPSPVTVTVKPAQTEKKIVSLKYNVNSLSLAEGGTGTVKVTATYSDGTTKDVTSECGLYSTSTGVATVTSSGTVKGVKAGKAKISLGTVPSGVSLPTPVDVTVITTVHLTKKLISLGYDGSATGCSILMTAGNTNRIRLIGQYSDGTTADLTSECGLYSTDTSVVTVDNNGTIRGIKAGKAKICIGTAPSGVTLPTPASVTVTPGPQSEKKIVSLAYSGSAVHGTNTLLMEAGTTDTISVTAKYSDGTVEDVTKECGLYSTDTSVVTVTSSGLIKAVKLGTARISISTVPDGASMPTPIAVTVLRVNTKPIIQPSPSVEKVVLTSSMLNMTPGQTSTLSAVVKPTDALYNGIAWKSSDESIAKVDNNGKVTAVSPGDCVITATAGGVSGMCNVRVSEYSKSDFSIRVMSGPSTITNGGTGSFMLDIQTPIPYQSGVHPLVLYCAINVPGRGWVEYQSRYFDGGNANTLYQLDTSLNDVPNGSYLLAFSLFYADRFYTGASIVDTIQRITLE